jgi:hypothetical protein
MDNFVRSSIPQMSRFPEQPGIKPLFHSVRDIALILDKTVQAGYGYLQAGTVMAINLSTGGGGGYGKLIPYVPLSGDVVLGQDSAVGIAPVVLDSTTNHVFVSLNDSYKFEVGDFLYVDNDSDEGPISGGVISAIDRTTSTIYADITVASLTETNVTVTKKAYAYVMGGAGGNNVAAYILDKDIDTGVGVDALGALTSVVVSNCILYKNSLINMTAAAITALGVVDGRFFIMK